MSLIALLVLSLGGCEPALRAWCPPRVVREVAWIQDGVAEPMADARYSLTTVVPADVSCESSVRILLEASDGSYQATLDLSAYASGAEVITPEQPFDLRFPTLARFEPMDAANTQAHPNFMLTWSGGPASYAVDERFVHTLTLEGPVRCDHVPHPPACTPSTPVTFTFTGPLDEVVCTTMAVTAEGPSPSGLAYCVDSGRNTECEIAHCDDTP